MAAAPKGIALATTTPITPPKKSHNISVIVTLQRPLNWRHLLSCSCMFQTTTRRNREMFS